MLSDGSDINARVAAPPRPAYVLDGIPPAVRAGISDASSVADMSLADTIRASLCAHFELDCPPIGRGYERARDGGATRMVLRVDQRLFDVIKAEAYESSRSMKAVILDVLERQFGEENQ